MDISKMLNVSTAHITKETAEFIQKVCKNYNLSKLIVYDKSLNYDGCTEIYGWFIYCKVNCTDLDVPKDLIKIMCFARDNGCEWLCLDRNYDVIENEYLDVYEW